MSSYRRTPKKKKTSNKNAFFTIKTVFLSCIYLSLIGGIVVLGFLYYLSQHLPALDEMINPKYDLPTQMYDRDNQLVTEFYTKHRVLIQFDNFPDVLVNALLAIEDNGFYSHYGIAPFRMAKALLIDIIAGSYVQGASTITQQAAKMFLLTKDKKIIRKLKEILLALKIESRFSKNQILELYLNKTYFGHGAYGIEAAARDYFGKSTEELNLAEAALLAGLPKAPSKYAPTASIKKAIRRRNLVLMKMDELGYITTQQRIQTMLSKIDLKVNKHLDYNETSYFVEHIRRYVSDKYGTDKLYRGGLKVYSTMDLKKQIYAQNALHDGIADHDRRQGYRGPLKNLLKEVDHELGLFVYSDEKGWNQDAYKAIDDDTQAMAKELFTEKITKTTKENHFIIGGTVLGVVLSVNKKSADVKLKEFSGSLYLNTMRWARPVDYETSLNWKTRLKDLNDILKIGDVVELEIRDYDNEKQEFSLSLTQKPLANGAILSVDPYSGHILAMSGGFDFRKSEFNRAIQAKRQTGSAFKPLVFSLALDNSFTAASMLDDTPYVGDEDGGYKPQNYGKSFLGKVSMREAMIHSKNIPALNLTRELGTDAVIEHARKMGITSALPEGELNIVLGTASLTLSEMVRAFGIFANGGNLVQPTYILKIVDRDGNILEDNTELVSERILSEETAFLVTSMLSDVVTSGSGWRAQAINRPSAGKTGSTDDYVDAWYIGYIPQMITGVYVGFDQNQQSLGHEETGSKAAAPIWTNYMKQAVDTMAILPFDSPDGINMVKINVDSGLLDCNTGGKTRFEYFKTGTEPTQCHQIQESSPNITETNVKTGEETDAGEEEIEEL